MYKIIMGMADSPREGGDSLREGAVDRVDGTSYMVCTLQIPLLRCIHWLGAGSQRIMGWSTSGD